MACGNEKLIPVVGVLALFNLIGHVAIIVTIKKLTRLHTKSYMILVSLSFADMLMGISLFPASLASKMLQQNGKPCDNVQTAAEFFLYTSLFSSMFNVVMLNIDRYQACVYCFQYTDEISKRLLRRLLLFWAISSLISGVCLLEAPTDRDTPGIVRERLSSDIIHVSIAVGGFLFIAVCQCHLHRISARFLNSVIKERSRLYGRQAEKLALVRRQRRATFVVLAITLAYSVCHLPMAIMKIFRFANHTTNVTKQIEVISAPLIPLSTALNPLVYGLSSATLRKAFCQMLSSHTQFLKRWFNMKNCSFTVPRIYRFSHTLEITNVYQNRSCTE